MIMEYNDSDRNASGRVRGSTRPYTCDVQKRRTTDTARRAPAAAAKGAPRAGRPARSGNGRALPETPERATAPGYRPTVFLTGRTQKKAEPPARQTLAGGPDSGLDAAAPLPPPAAMPPRYRARRTPPRGPARPRRGAGPLALPSG